MDVFDVLLQVGLITSAIVAYLLVFRRKEPWKGKYRTAGWNYPLKLLYAKHTLYWWKRRQPPTVVNQDPSDDQREGLDEVNLRLTSPEGAAVLLSIRKICGRKPLVEITVFVKLSDGTTYVLPQHPQTLIGAWVKSEGEWSAGGLKIQILEPLRWRVIYNGLLRRTQDNVVLHAKLNLIWVSGSSMVLHPDDWSTELAAEALAVTPWRDGNWPDMLIKHKETSWLQYGAAQGRFLTFDPEGNIDTSEYLRVRGVRGRGAARGGHAPVRRQVVVTAVGEEGTMVTMRCVAYKDGLTQCISGSVRQPGYQVEPITGTDLMMADFYETPITVVNNYSINVSTKSRSIRMTLRMNDDGGELTSGTDQQLQILYNTFSVDIDGFSGSGILELGYETTEAKEPSYPLTPAPLLKWVSKTEAGEVGFCVSFEERGAACTDYVGGKGASLALLASVQKEEGYKVPPGFCLTIKALDHYLEQNPQIMKAIEDIEASTENYDENVFKQKCEKASSMFLETEIAGNLKNDILTSMAALRTKAQEEIGGDLRFAVRSSAVGEDSEVLSAAGQNETILGCVSDEDVLIGVQKCWASMFAFTSAFYRRENGQACYCGGGAVVQALARARAAGVLFTRHPAAGDPARVLVTANYGLGESVVSGSVEPDTFIVRRNGSDLTIASSIIGAKKQRINVAGNGVGVVDVPEGEQSVACLGAEEVLRLAAVGGRQELLWGAGRDVEWAFVENDLYLLQARPITSLERWTEEELLHEADDPVMADDELTSFGNTGEVLPRPLTALSNDIVKIALTHNFDKAVEIDPRTLEHSIVTTHYRCALSLYSSIYKQMPKEIDTGIRMVEMAVHGHKVADDAILATALHRRKPRLTDKLKTMTILLKSLLTSKRSMDNSIKESTAMATGEHINDISEMLTFIDETNKILQSLSSYHSVTSTASSASQIIAMSILLEGGSEFSPEVCNEISSLLSSGDVLSAEVPQSLARLARRLEASGRYDEFRRVPRAHAFQWLEKQLPEVHGEVCEFLKHHGHRAFMEFELATTPWVLVPEDMMKVLQNLRASKEEEQVTKSDNEIIAALESPQKASTRKVLRWVLPLCRRTVRHREATKAALILGVHRARLAARRLARLLARRWLVPRPHLVFHFRRRELQRYLATRDPALLRKAIQRSQYHPGWCKLKFNEINRGWVSPQEDKGPLVIAGDVKIQAASVCGGEVIARACVVNDLSEIDQLQQGDILITHATDIGWSPYFPLISGIVTELGGLISHGAVIAREYGLPCIVGAARATELFRTGDTVRLAAARGAVERVQLHPAAAPTHS